MKQITIKMPYPLSLRYTSLSHGWVNLAPWKCDDKRSILSRSEKIGHKIVHVSVKQKDPKNLIAKIDQDNLSKPHEKAIKSTVCRWLSIDWNPSEFLVVAKKLSPSVADYVLKGGGRFLRGSTFYEDFVKTLCTINASWAFTKSMISNIVTEIGSGVFPEPMQILNGGIDCLKNTVKMGYRAKILIESTKILQAQDLIMGNGKSRDGRINYDKLRNIRGIGHYASSHLMFLLHDYSQIPIDSEVTKYCKKTYGIDRKAIQDFFSEWGKFPFLGYKLSRIIERDNWIG